VRFVRRAGGRRPHRTLHLGMQPGERLSEGVSMRLDVGVRLLGATVLRLDGDVVLSPARPDVVPALPARPVAPAFLAAAATADTGRLGSELDRAESLYGESVGVLRVADATPR